MAKLFHLTTVHPRNDVRIFEKQIKSLSKIYGGNIALIVCDGKGEELFENGVIVYDLGKPKLGRLGRFIGGGLKAFLFIVKKRPILVHFHDPELIFVALALKIFGIKVIYDVHEDVPKQMSSKDWIPKFLMKPLSALFTVVEWVASKAFDGIIVVTRAIGVRFPDHKTVLVQNFPLKEELIIANSMPYLERPNKFGYVGVIADIRCAKEMVQAIGLINDEIRCELEIAGSFSPIDLRDELGELPGWKYVNYRGLLNRKEVANLLGTVRGGLVIYKPLPNHVEAQPNKMFEYMAAGIPVIASDFPLWRGIIENTDCGVVVSPLSVESIASAMKWIINHPKESYRMGDFGKAAVDAKFNWEEESIKLVEFYEKLGINDATTAEGNIS